MNLRPYFFVLPLAVPLLARADVVTKIDDVPFTFSGELETYYVDDFSATAFANRQLTPSGASPDYSDSRKDHLGVNEGLLDGKFAADQWRAALGIQGGTYVQKNYADENDVAQHFYEAVLGLKPNSGVPLWVDAGVFSSHIGLESAVAKDDWTPTRSLMADNTPYYESGAKVTWDPDSHWEYCVLLLQGWQEIGSRDSNKAVGTQIQYKPTGTLLFNSSTYLGQSPDSRARLRRYFHDFYATWQATKGWAFALAADVGADERSPRDRSLIGWTSGSALAKWQFASQWAAAGRLEYYSDPHGLTVATGTAGNFRASGGSVNLDYQPDPHVLVRFEIRTLNAREAIFVERDGLNDSNGYATVSTTLSF